MTPEQETHLFDTLGDIRASQGRIEAVMDSHLNDDIRVHQKMDDQLNTLTISSNKNATSIARLRGFGAGIGGVVTLVLGYLGIDNFGG